MTTEDLKDVRDALRSFSPMKDGDDPNIEVLLYNRMPIAYAVNGQDEIKWDATPIRSVRVHRHRSGHQNEAIFGKREVWRINDVALVASEGDLFALGFPIEVVDAPGDVPWNPFPFRTILLDRFTRYKPEEVHVRMSHDCRQRAFTIA